MMRNDNLDYFRGIAILNVIFIHTVWWSGILYNHFLVRQAFLLFEVPVFFSSRMVIYLSNWLIGNCMF